MSLPLSLPIDPMLATSVNAIPTGGGFVHEPKWDGFRCIISRDGDEIVLGSRGKKALTVYFPEVVEALSGWLPDGAILDAELVVRAGEPGAERLDWDSLGQRIHPAISRITMLAEMTPAEVICFDVLAADGLDLTAEPWEVRRARLEQFFADADPHPAIHLSRYTDDAQTATEWFTQFEGAGLDGVVSKARDGVYTPGKRGWQKIKHKRTAEAVVIGYRVHKRGHGVGSLLLGLYDDQGNLIPVGGIGALSDEMRDALVAELDPLVIKDADGNPVLLDKPRSRFSKSTDPVSIALEPELVAEVAFDQLEGHRFRHAVTLVRFRPDRDARSCLLEQVDRAPSYDLARVLAQ
ncbi:MAG: ATP-dependent DNA ligase [Propionibacteriaceae bacterium]|nr:ATP-dependent DNA ligase [Propionibacteriaceae bacterium]